jgi:hypothetical protein
MNLLDWWYLIFEKVCDGYAHLQEDVFTMRLERNF